MNDFKLDLGLERFKSQKNFEYINGGVKIAAGDFILTKFDFQQNSDSPNYLGTYLDIIWQNIAVNASKLSNKKEIEFYIITEGWDPKFNVTKKDKYTLELSMAEESSKIEGIKVPRTYVDGVEVNLENFFQSIIESGEQLKEFYDMHGTNPAHIDNIEKLIDQLEKTARELKNN